MRKPLDGNPRITTPFGADRATYAQFGLNGHHGIDYGVDTNTNVYAAEAGTVLMSANGVADQYTGNGVAGETIVIKGKTHEEWYLHLSKRLVRKGQQVKAGQLIGYSGATGYVTGPHLHFGMRPHKPNIRNGFRGFIDPMPLLKATTGGTTVSKTDKADLDAIYLYGPLGRKRKPGEGEDVYLNKEVSFVLKDHYNSKPARDKRAAASKPVVKPVADPDGSKWRKFKELLGIK